MGSSDLADNPVAVAAVVIFVALAYHLAFEEQERWKLVLFATVPAVLLPYQSGDYTLIHMYFPLVFFLNSPRASPWDIAYVTLFGVLLVPVDYYYIINDVSISVIIYPLAMLALLLLAIRDGGRLRRRSGGEARGCGRG